MRLGQLRRAHLKAERDRWGDKLAPIPRSEWPAPKPDVRAPIAALRSRDFLVQIFEEDGGTRMTVNRADLVPGKGIIWRDGISWDDLQRLKNEAGFGGRWMVECYPPDGEVIDVANMRHLWLLPGAPTYGWQKGRP